MALDPAANFVRVTTAEAVDNAQTSISVADASPFPDPSADGNYNVVIWDADNFPRPDQDSDVEVLRVTATDTGTDTLTVTRGEEGTAAASHPNGAAVHLSPTAKMFSDIQTKTKGLSDDGTALSIGDLSITDVLSDMNLVGSGTESVPSNDVSVVVDAYDETGVLFGSAHQSGSSGAGSPELRIGGNEQISMEISPVGDGSGLEVALHNKYSGNLNISWVVFEYVAP